MIIFPFQHLPVHLAFYFVANLYCFYVLILQMLFRPFSLTILSLYASFQSIYKEIMCKPSMLRGGDRETDTYKDRKRNRQTEEQRERVDGRKKDRERERKREREKEREIERERECVSE